MTNEPQEATGMPGDDDDVGPVSIPEIPMPSTTVVVDAGTWRELLRVKGRTSRRARSPFT